MPATMTLWGLYKWDNTIFDTLVIPYTVEKEDIVNNILLECSELEVVYPDPDFMKTAIGSWATARIVAWQHYVEIMKVKYNPIENTDKYENISYHDTDREQTTTSDSGQITTTSRGTDVSKGTGIDAMTRTQQTNNTNSVSAFDTENYSNANKQLNDVDENSDTKKTVDIASNATNEGLDTHSTNTDTLRQRSFSHGAENHIHGNIGVTTNQQMLTQEVDFWRWDLLHQIAKEFRQKFCISVY